MPIYAVPADWASAENSHCHLFHLLSILMHLLCFHYDVAFSVFSLTRGVRRQITIYKIFNNETRGQERQAKQNISACSPAIRCHVGSHCPKGAT
jgi:hypothetical protein